MILQDAEVQLRDSRSEIAGTRKCGSHPRFSSQVELTSQLLLRMADMHESTKLVGVAGDSFCSS